MARKTDLEDILFPVALHPVYADIPEGDKKIKVLIPASQVVINMETGNALGVVSRDYKLITNNDAIDLGRKCCQELLELENADALEIFNVIAPSTASYCHIDLVYKGYEMNLFDSPTKPDIYFPIVRVTNSYNTTRALRFNIGFCRTICLNGTIFESETIKFIYSHVKHEIGKPIKFNIEKDKMRNLIDEFKSVMKGLKDLTVKMDSCRLVFNIVFGMPDLIKADINDMDKEEYYSLTEHIEKLFDKYYKEEGGNAYALFNIITDMASHPPDNKFFRRDINAMQRTAGAWAHDLRKRIGDDKDGFKWSNYIEELKQRYRDKSSQNIYN